MNKFNKTTLEELKAKNLPHATAADLGITIAVDISPEDTAAAAAKIAELNKYLEAFTIMEDGKCICCGAVQGAKDPIMGLLTGARFTLGNCPRGRLLRPVSLSWQSTAFCRRMASIWRHSSVPPGRINI